MDSNRVGWGFSRFQRSLAFRFNVIIGVALLIISTVSLYTTSTLEQRSLNRDLENQAARLTELLAVNVATPLFTFNQSSLSSIAKAFASDPLIRSLEIKDASGKIVASVSPAKTQNRLIGTQRQVKLGAEVIGSVSVGLSTETIDESMRESWKIGILRELSLYVLLFSLLCFLLRRHVTRPLGEMNQTLQRAKASNNLTMRLDLQRQDEIGELAGWFNSFVAELDGIIRSIGGSVQRLTESADDLMAVSQRMSANAEETAAQANVVSATSEQVSHNVQTVASGTEQMSASIREIAGNATEAARMAGDAVRVAERTNATVGKLGDASGEIGQVIKVINAIAEQTNLLALNATIEAARAGEAGKGFAVVANEVKELAKQTGNATQDISQKIQSIQGSTKDAVQAIGEIGKVINQINDISNTIASAVEEQSVTTNNISQNVAEAARGVGEITQNVAAVTEAATSTSGGASDTQMAAGELARVGTELHNLVGQFKYSGDESQPAMNEKRDRFNGSGWNSAVVKRSTNGPGAAAHAEL